MVWRTASVEGPRSMQDAGGSHMTEADQEGSLLGSTGGASALPTYGGRPVLLAGATVLALVAGIACTIAAGRGSTIHAERRSGLTSLQGRTSVNLDLTLTNLPHQSLSSDPVAQDEVEQLVEAIFKDALPDCEIVAVDVVKHKIDTTSTTVQVLMFPRNGANVDDVAAFVTNDLERNRLQALMMEAMDGLVSVQNIRTGEVGIASMEEAPQDGVFQYLTEAAAAGSDIVPMGDTTLQVGDRLQIGGRLVPTQVEVTVEDVFDGNLKIQPPLKVACPPGALVILIGTATDTPAAATATPAPAPTPIPTAVDMPAPTAVGTSTPAAATTTDTPAPAAVASEPASSTAADAPVSSASAPPTVTQTVILQGLPSSDLSVEQVAAVEDKVRVTYAAALGKDTSQVKATVKSPRRRRLRALADSAEQATEVEVSVQASPGESMAQLEEQMEDAKGAELKDKVVAAVESVPGISDIATSGIKADVRDERGADDTAQRPMPMLLALLAGALLIVVAIACCACIACGKKGARDATEFSEPNNEEQAPGEAASAGSLAPEPAEPAKAAEGGFLAPEEASDLPEEPPVEPQEMATEQVAEDSRRTELISQIFQKFDVDGDGYLNEREIGDFAQAWCEFDGSDEDWAFEYQEVCKDLGATEEQGIDLNHFTHLVNDSGSPDEDGVPAMYCTDETLEQAAAASPQPPMPPDAAEETAEEVVPPLATELAAQASADDDTGCISCGGHGCSICKKP